MSSPLLSIIIPVFNEKDTIEIVLQRTLSLGVSKEIIVVDDGSVDGTREKLRDFVEAAEVRVVYHEKNAGKGAALSTGFALAQGKWCIPQDADLECYPEDILLLLEHAETIAAKDPYLNFAVYGSRFLRRPEKKLLTTYIANKVITTSANILYGASLSDVMTCYKLIPKAFLQNILPLRSRSFEVEAELTARLLRAGYKIYEQPIRYQARSYKEGKKIKVEHFFRVMRALAYFRWGAMETQAVVSYPQPS